MNDDARQEMIPGEKPFPWVEVLSGSTIIVPTKLRERENTLPLLKEIASITLSAVTMAYIVWQVYLRFCES